MPTSQAEKGKRFQALHARPGAFVIPNPWDAGTARILTSLGFETLTTTSAGLVGGSIEDTTGDPQQPLYAFQHAVECVAAAVEAARALPFPFVLVGRAENYLHRRPDLAALGVRRISLGSALSRAALGAFHRAAREIKEHGTFTFAKDAMPYAEANDLVSGH